jgi:carbazole 1,9a-dioxygenase terminal dioxygenase component
VGSSSKKPQSMAQLEKGPIEAWEEQRKKPWQVYVNAELGFRNHWYPAFFSRELGEADVSDASGAAVSELKVVTLLGERILFRRVDGKVHGVQDWCLHRGVPFSARPECYTKDTITCWYHGFTYDLRDGSLKAILTDPDSPLIGKIGLRNYQVIEAQNIVWVFVGDLDPAPPLATDVPPGLLDDTHWLYPEGWSQAVKCNWRPAVENGFDPSHVYVHRNGQLISDLKVPVAYSTVDISMVHDLDVVDSGPGPYGVKFVTRKARPVWEADIDGTVVSSRYKPSDAAEDEGVFNREIPEVHVWMPCGVMAKPFPFPGVTHYEFLVPIDEHNHRYLITWGKDVGSDEEREEFNVLMRGGWAERVITGFSNEDVFSREQLAEFYSRDEGWFRERLFGPDVAITTWRKLASRKNRGIQRRDMQ